MNILDIIVLALTLYALWRGWSSGILVQLSGLVGVVLGTWLAHSFSERACEWFSVEAGYKWLVFTAILVVVLVAIIVLCRLLTNILKNAGLSLPIKMLGAVVSLVKVIVILALILRTFESANNKGKFVEDSYLRESFSFEPIDNVASTIFPYITEFFDKPDQDTSKTDGATNPKIEKKQGEQKLEENNKTKR